MLLASGIAIVLEDEMPLPELSYREITLTQGQVAIVDAEDFEWLNQWKWRAKKGTHRFYATRTVRSGDKKNIAMHRLIIGIDKGDGMQTDHINLDTLDNRCQNLRVATVSENNRNKRVRRDSASGHKGIIWDKRKNRWLARITLHGKRSHLGYFANIEDAASSYACASNVMHGEFARSA